MQKSRKNRKGFTLVELMVVVVIIGILTAIAIPVYMSVTANAAEKACQANQRTIDSALMIYNAEHPDAVLDAIAAADMTGIFVPNYLAEMPSCPTDKAVTYAIVAGLCVTTCTATATHSLH